MKKFIIITLLFACFYNNASERRQLTFSIPPSYTRPPHVFTRFDKERVKHAQESFENFKDAFRRVDGFEEIKKLVNLGYTINCQGYDGQTLLHYFLKTLEEQKKMREDLMLSADNLYLVPTVGGTGYTPESLDEVNKIVTLLTTPENLSTRDNGGYTPIMLARDIGIENTTDTFRALQNAATPAALRDAIQTRNVQQIIQLINSGASIWGCIRQFDTLFALAKDNKELEDIIFFDISHTNNLSDERGGYLLYLACKNNLQRLAPFIISKIKDINAPLDSLGNSALHTAAQFNAHQIINMLFSRDVDINKINNTGETPLCLAASKNSTEAAQELIRQGADVTISQNSLLTPLHLAAFHNNVVLMTLLLDNNANINAENDALLTPLDYAYLTKNNNPEARVFLRGRGATSRRD